MLVVRGRIAPPPGTSLYTFPARRRGLAQEGVIPRKPARQEDDARFFIAP